MFTVRKIDNNTGQGFVPVNLGGNQSAFHPVNSPTQQKSPTTKKLQLENTGLVFHLKHYKANPPSDANPPPSNRNEQPQSVSDEKSIKSMNPVNFAELLKGRFTDDLNCPASSPSESSPPSTCNKCHICNDRATGKHYGASSCDGCKGFFRRTVRKNQGYTCRFSNACHIDKDKRNTCRFCRYNKCLRAGMKKQAVQSERDRINVRRKKNPGPTAVPSEISTGLEPTALLTVDVPAVSSDMPLDAGLISGSDASQSLENSRCTESSDQLEALKHAEHLFANQQQQQAAALLASNGTPASAGSSTPSSPLIVAGDGQPSWPHSHSSALRLASVNDLADAIKEQLLLLVEWAKALPPFIDLSLDDQVSLLRAYAAEHLLLGVARRSLPFEDVLLLSNDACIPRNHSSQIHDVNHVILRILDELVEPMRELQLDDTENGCLKALLFFNPSAFGLVNKQRVKQTRQSFLEAFHEYVTTKRSQNDKVRFGNLLLLLPPLQSMSQQFIEDLQLATLFGISTFDKLLEELLLATGNASSPFLTDGFSAVAKKMAGNQNQVIDLIEPTVDQQVHTLQMVQNLPIGMDHIVDP